VKSTTNRKEAAYFFQEGFLRTVPPPKMPPFDPFSIDRSEKSNSTFVFAINGNDIDNM
jgi:hypothetical protein